MQHAFTVRTIPDVVLLEANNLVDARGASGKHVLHMPMASFLAMQIQVRTTVRLDDLRRLP